MALLVWEGEWNLDFPWHIRQAAPWGVGRWLRMAAQLSLAVFDDFLCEGTSDVAGQLGDGAIAGPLHLGLFLW